MDHGTSPRQQSLERRIVHCQYFRRQIFIGQISLIANQQDCTAAKRLRRSNAFVIEIARDPDCRRSQSKDNRRWPSIQKTYQLCRHGQLFAAIIKREPCSARLWWPVRLWLAEQARKQCQYESRGMLSFEDRTTAIWQTELIAKLIVNPALVYLLHLLEKCSHHARTKQFHVTHPLPERRHRRVIGGEERARRQHARHPWNTSCLRHQGPREGDWMSHQEVCILHCVQRVFITFAHKWEQHLV